MSLTPGDRFGVYEITGPLGAGGMGEVYRARDTKLDRDVALKVLPDALATDPERTARFEREAKTLALLNHPHIAQIYGFEHFGNTAILVMELVEGQDLAERLKIGALPVDEALPIARQIAEALEAAHEAGIIHRDLKPANVKVRADGEVKVLDFGLAKAIDTGTRGSDPSGGVLPDTISTPPAITGQGSVLGTAAYMAPEQARGKPVDRRADIWAFGCVLYEMLTGSRAVSGEDLSSTLASLLRDDPRWQMLPPDTPPHIRTLLRRCLQKDPQKRLPHIGAARLDLIDDHHDLVDMAPPPTPRRRPAFAAAWALLGALVTAAIAFMIWPRGAVDTKAVRFSIVPRPGEVFVGANLVPRFAVSRDGRWIVYQTQDGKRSKMWLRGIDSLDETEIAGSESGAGGNTRQQPFWSADGQFIAFFDEDVGQLKKLPREGGATQTIAEITGNQLGGAWNAGNVIVMASMGTRGIRRVAATGGAVSQLTTIDASKHEVSHLWPDFLGDERHFVYLVSYSDDTPPALFVGSIDGGASTRLVESPAAAAFLAPDRLAYVRNGALIAQRLDAGSVTLIGDTPAITDAAAYTAPGRLAVSASRTGVLIFSSGSANGTLETLWINRAGQPLAAPPPSVSVGMSGIRLSPDGTRLVFGRAGSTRFGRQVTEYWVQDVARGIETRLTDTAFSDVPPVFSPDSGRVAFQRGSPPYNLIAQSVTGATEGLELMPAPGQAAILPFDWSPDGSRVLISEFSTSRRTATIATSGDRTAATYLDVPVEAGAVFSPDGRYVAVTEGSGNTRQVFLRSFPSAAAGRWVMSTPGGLFPRWRRDGRELFYQRDGVIVAVPVRLSPSVEIGTPVPLFQLPLGLNTLFPLFDVMPDGQTFVTLRRRNAGLNPARLTVVVNWPAALH